MGTRSLTVFKNDYDWSGEEIVVMYRQYDGYPEGHGMELARFLSKGKMVNGLSSSVPVQFNGMGCLAAQVVAHFKDGAGGFYLYPGGTRDVGEEYIYEVYSMGINRQPYMKVLEIHFHYGTANSAAVLHDGPVSEFLKWAGEVEEEQC